MSSSDRDETNDMVREGVAVPRTNGFSRRGDTNRRTNLSINQAIEAARQGRDALSEGVSR